MIDWLASGFHCSSDCLARDILWIENVPLPPDLGPKYGNCF